MSKSFSISYSNNVYLHETCLIKTLFFRDLCRIWVANAKRFWHCHQILKFMLQNMATQTTNIETIDIIDIINQNVTEVFFWVIQMSTCLKNQLTILWHQKFQINYSSERLNNTTLTWANQAFVWNINIQYFGSG